MRGRFAGGVIDDDDDREASAEAAGGEDISAALRLRASVLACEVCIAEEEAVGEGAGSSGVDEMSTISRFVVDSLARFAGDAINDGRGTTAESGGEDNLAASRLRLEAKFASVASGDGEDGGNDGKADVGADLGNDILSVSRLETQLWNFSFGTADDECGGEGPAGNGERLDIESDGEPSPFAFCSWRICRCC